SLGTNSQVLLIPGGETDAGLAVIFPLGVTEGFSGGGGSRELAPSTPNEVPVPQAPAQSHDPSVVGPRLLTGRELQIVGLLAKGFSGPGIAEHLSIAESTVQAHVQNAMRKTGSATRTGLVAMAMSDGVIKV
ncbi:MAG: helix-turn-helix transcriptional regulator, partial [Solirubrobacterales bacterium]|nr:helix-turn-helix transcriptional regulator [Solirubrobacterales bacterium]